ncbi:MAG: heavy metal-associated domain-containing protein [Candidatus Methanomethylophilaceae archaeon]|jgi:copper chaperone CopZ|nr:heavy metal-associated domain-containing protein [Candidatus Methanomethylophilaceae archaeon]NLF34090.1 heavy-metal-associated domain-containing protein [Thermoplasmatales archaeon]
MKKVTLNVEGMGCNACVEKVEAALRGCPGVVSAEVSLKKKRAVVEYEGDVPTEGLVRAVEDAGFEAAVKRGMI